MLWEKYFPPEKGGEAKNLIKCKLLLSHQCLYEESLEEIMVVAGSFQQHARLRAFSADTFVCKAGYTFSSTLFSRSMSSVRW
jgi:hypothetical protein